MSRNSEVPPACVMPRGRASPVRTGLSAILWAVATPGTTHSTDNANTGRLSLGLTPPRRPASLGV